MKTQHTKVFRFTILFLISCSILSAANVDRKIILPRVEGDISVDGRLTEPIWQKAIQIKAFYEISPGDNTPPAVNTIGYLAYDSRYLYVAIYSKDPKPGDIRASFTDRDSVFGDQDFVQFDLDTKNDEKSSFLFRVNPRGVRLDGIFSESTGLDDYSPDFSFEVETSILDDGWIAEYRVPLSTLRYSQSPIQEWGITIYRNYPREFRHQILSLPMPRGATCWLCYSMKLTQISNLPPSRYLLVVPFATAQQESQKSVQPESSTDLDGGVDLKWIPKNNLTLDATVNPDFAQVEADVPQISVNNRFALFYPEKRTFFLEQTDLLTTPLQVIYTRTITSPAWGARATGLFADATYTFLATEDEGGGSQIIPGPLFSELRPQQGNSFASIGRLRYARGKIFGGIVFTDRESDFGFNRLIGPDIQWRPTETNQVIGQILASATKDEGTNQVNDYALLLSWLHSAPSRVLQLDYQRLGHDFRADNGFVPQVGVERKAASGGYRFYPSGWLRFIQPGFTWDSYIEIDGLTVSRSTFPYLTMRGKWNSLINLEYHFDEQVRTSTEVMDYDFMAYSFQIQPSRLLSSIQFSGKIGDQIDVVNERVGSGATFAVKTTIRPGIHLNTEFQAERQWLNISQDRLFTADVAQLRLTYNFTSRMFLRTIAQYEKIHRNLDLYTVPEKADEGSFNGSILYGYRFNWQTVLYAGYGNEGSIMEGNHYHSDLSNFFFKVAYAFEH
ncbi:MAG TPA: DUF5916 domain-containing protein [Acidobacteriota bacterium]|nr:DUF5916 domain-containing protein [Acidobacteriota bacterium]